MCSRLLMKLCVAFLLSASLLYASSQVPGIAAEGADFVQRLQSDNIWVVLVQKMRDGLGDQVVFVFD